MKKTEIKRISRRFDAIQIQYNGWTTKKRVDGKVYRKTAEEMKRMFEQLDRAAQELSNMDSKLRLKQLRLMESKGGIIGNNYAEVNKENPELSKLLQRIDKVGNVIRERIEPIQIHLSIRAEIDSLVTEFVEEIKDTATVITEVCGNENIHDVKELNELASKLELWQQDTSNDYCIVNRDPGSLPFDKRNGVFIRDELGSSFNYILRRLGQHKKDNFFNMVKPLELKRDAILQYLDELQEKKRSADSTTANKPPKKDEPSDLIDLAKAVELYHRSRAQLKRDIEDDKIKDYRKIKTGKHWISKSEADNLYILK